MPVVKVGIAPFPTAGRVLCARTWVGVGVLSLYAGEALLVPPEPAEEAESGLRRGGGIVDPEDGPAKV